MANEIALQSEERKHPLDENLRPLKIGNKTAPLELSDTDVRVNNLQVSGTTSGVSASDDTKLPLAGGTMTGDITTDSNIVSTDLTIDDSGDITLDAGGGEVYVKEGGNTFAEFSTAGSKMSLRLFESAGGADYGNIYCAANGATTILTVDAAGSDADLTLKADGDIILDSTTGVFIAKKAGTEFSVADSAYAGMIIGYRMIGEDTVHSTYTLTTSFVVPDSDMTVRFIAPPSGAVEVMVQVLFDGASNRVLNLGLSDNATYNTIGATYETIAGLVDETDQQLINWRVVVTGLTAGDTYNYWLGATANGGSLLWGGTGTGRYSDFIMKVTALPTAVADYAVYG